MGPYGVGRSRPTPSSVRVLNGRIHAGMVRVVFELSEVGEHDGGTHFVVGSHKPTSHTPDHLSSKRQAQPISMSYACPAGSAVFFTALPRRPHLEKDRAAGGGAQRAHTWPPTGTASCPCGAGRPAAREAGLLRIPWVADFHLPGHHQHHRAFCGQQRSPIDTNHQPWRSRRMKIARIDSYVVDAGWRPWILVVVADNGLKAGVQRRPQSLGRGGAIEDFKPLLIGQDPRAYEMRFWDLIRAARASLRASGPRPSPASNAP